MKIFFIFTAFNRKIKCFMFKSDFKQKDILWFELWYA